MSSKMYREMKGLLDRETDRVTDSKECLGESRARVVTHSGIFGL